MHQSEDQEQDQQPENWLGSFELECLDHLQSEPNLEEKLLCEKDLAEQHLFVNFQNSATAIAQLYKDRHQVVWLPFQTAALAVTNMYKESVNRIQHCVELGQQTGRYSRNRDIVAWARKKRRHIRRDELLAFLSGKAPPCKGRLNSASGSKRHSVSHERNLPRHPLGHNLAAPDNVDVDLGTFQQALALQGLNGAMSNISMGYHGHNAGAQPVGSVEDLNHFIHEEVLRHHEHRKRSTQSQDCVLDSPARKRSRLL